MRAMFGNTLTAISMTNPDAAFPATNALEKHPSKEAKATGQTTTITATGSRAKHVALLNLGENTLVTVTVYDTTGGGSTLVYTEAFIPWGCYTYEDYYLGNFTQEEIHLITLPAYYYDIRVVIALTSSSPDVASLGLVMAGYLQDYGEAEWGIADEPQDFGIYHETVARSLIYFDRGVAKNKNVPIRTDRSRWLAFYRDLIAHNNEYGLYLFQEDGSMFCPSAFIRYGRPASFPKVPEDGDSTSDALITFNLQIREVN